MVYSYMCDRDKPNGLDELVCRHHLRCVWRFNCTDLCDGVYWTGGRIMYMYFEQFKCCNLMRYT